MKHLTIVIPDGQSNLSTLACIIGAYEIFNAANAYRKEAGKKELFKVELAGVSDQAEFGNGLLALKAQSRISEIRKTHLIVIPSLAHEFQKISKGNKLLADWITKQYKNGAEIASMCTGAFMLASTGLLNGKNCSTHWIVTDTFRKLFPKVNLKPENLITDEQGIYTNGGGYSFLNLAIYLVEKYYSREAAIYCSKVFQIELDRQSQSAFIIFKGQKNHGDEMIKKAQAYIEDHLDEKISIQDLSSRLAAGRRNFDRRFIRATGNTPVEYLQRVKIESAKKSLETTRKTINEVMYEVGYSDVKAFREVFRKITAMSPLEYKHKYNKEAVAQYHGNVYSYSQDQQSNPVKDPFEIATYKK
ncbi:GlxA family transcriptional regulator [Compostibacter hankyongensis]|uniref:Helix-turn-helix domain-containing protein n=1 Tax=Compostibacter hankyongensis TaxID=1007089 RepID=A0ABP8GA07_9BACT